MRYMLCLEPELRSLLEDRLSNMKKENVDLETVAEISQTLEITYRLGSNKPKTINAISEEPTLSNDMFKTLLDAIKNISQSTSKQTDKPRFVDSKLQDYCMRYVKGTCPFGDRCKYKHTTPVPEDVLKHMKQRYKVVPKSA